MLFMLFDFGCYLYNREFLIRFAAELVATEHITAELAAAALRVPLQAVVLPHLAVAVELACPLHRSAAAVGIHIVHATVADSSLADLVRPFFHPVRQFKMYNMIDSTDVLQTCKKGIDSCYMT